MCVYHAHAYARTPARSPAHAHIRTRARTCAHAHSSDVYELHVFDSGGKLRSPGMTASTRATDGIKSLVRHLLRKDPSERMGHDAPEAHSILNHRAFNGVFWSIMFVARWMGKEASFRRKVGGEEYMANSSLILPFPLFGMCTSRKEMGVSRAKKEA